MHFVSETLRGHCHELRQAMRHVNALAHEIDPRLNLMMWGKAIRDSFTTIGFWSIIGVAASSFASEWTSGAGAGNIILILCAFVVGNLLMQALYSFTETRDSAFGDMLTIKLKNEMVKKLEQLDIARLLDPAFVRTMDQAKERGQSAVEALWRMQTELASATIAVAVSVSIVLTYDARLILAGLVLAVPSFLRAVALERYTRALFEAEHSTRRNNSEYERALIEPESRMQALFLGTAPGLWRRYSETRDELHHNLVKTRTRELHGELAMLVARGAAIGVMLIMLYPLLASGAIGITMLFVLMGVMIACADGLAGFSNALVRFAGKYRDILYWNAFNATHPAHKDGTEALTLHAAPPLRVENVTFAYPGNETPVLENLSLTIRSGEKVLLMGPNGSGKTTILQLLARLRVPQEGEVCIADRPVEQLTHASIRAHTVFVLQGTRLPEVPLFEAITGETDWSMVDTDRFRKAVSTTDVDGFVRDLTNGYLTRIGADWDDGTGFSTGQKQKLLLASALYRLYDPNVYIAFFDEALAHCDVEIKRTFYTHLCSLRDKTVVVVAHDPLFMDVYNRVIVLDHGTVVETAETPSHIRALRRRVVGE